MAAGMGWSRLERVAVFDRGDVQDPLGAALDLVVATVAVRLYGEAFTPADTELVAVHPPGSFLTIVPSAAV